MTHIVSMLTERKPEQPGSSDIWIISSGVSTEIDLKEITGESADGMLTEYRISELGEYMLNPNPITLDEKVIGCKIQYKKRGSGRIWRFIIRHFRGGPVSGTDTSVEDIISASKVPPPTFRDRTLNRHFIKIRELLRPYDPVQKKLSRLNRDNIENITAICEDIGKNRHQLNLKGSINDKINFVSTSLSKSVKVSFDRVYLMNGLFEMRGFNFPSFNPDKSFRLIRVIRKKQTKYCVLTPERKFLYWANDNATINYLHLLEQSIKSDHHLREAMNLCLRGEAQPLKLFFSRQREQSYSEKYLPKIYREVLRACNVGPGEIETIKKVLNDHQSIVSFNYVPKEGAGKNKLYTTVSVMHDVRALEPIKTTLPGVYSEINKKALISDAGRLYLLDSIKGYQNV